MANTCVHKEGRKHYGYGELMDEDAIYQALIMAVREWEAFKEGVNAQADEECKGKG